MHTPHAFSNFTIYVWTCRQSVTLYRTPVTTDIVTGHCGGHISAPGLDSNVDNNEFAVEEMCKNCSLNYWAADVLSTEQYLPAVPLIKPSRMKLGPNVLPYN